MQAHNINIHVVQTGIENTREKYNSTMKSRSHQRFITPPEGGSFRQLTSTRRYKNGRAENICGLPYKVVQKDQSAVCGELRPHRFGSRRKLIVHIAIVACDDIKPNCS